MNGDLTVPIVLQYFSVVNTVSKQSSVTLPSNYLIPITIFFVNTIRNSIDQDPVLDIKLVNRRSIKIFT